MTETVYTDGSALSNAKNACAGWAAYFVEEKSLRSGSLHATNNYAELWAIHYVLYQYEKKLKPVDMKITIKSDSLYAINVITDKYKAKANLELVNSIKTRIQRLKADGNTISLKHVPAHTGGTDKDSVYNDIVDKEARRRAEMLRDKK